MADQDDDFSGLKFDTPTEDDVRKQQMTHEPRTPIKSAGEEILKKIFDPIGDASKLADAALVASQPATFNLMDDFEYLIGGVKGLAREGKFSGPAKENRDLFDETRAVSKDRLARVNSAIPFIAEMVGAMTPGSGPATLAKNMFTSARHTGKLGSRIREIGRQAQVGGAEALMAQAGEMGVNVENVASGRSSLAEEFANVGLTTAGGILAGAGGQLVLGEVVPLMYKYGLRPLLPGEQSSWKVNKVGNTLLDTGPSGAGITPDNIRLTYPGVADGKSLSELAIGDTQKGEMVDRFVNLLSDSEFPTNNRSAGGMTAADAEQFAHTVSWSNKIADDARVEMLESLDSALGTGDSLYARARQRDESLRPIREAYKNLSDSKATVKYQNAMDRLNQRTADNMSGKKDSDPEIMARATQKYLDLVSNRMRTPILNRNTRTLEVPQHGDAGNQVDLGDATVTMRQLLDARTELSGKIKPGTLLGGNTTTKVDARAGKAVLDALDTEIANRTFGRNNVMREQFQQFMKQDDAYISGREFFSNRLVEDPEFGRNLGEYMEAIKDDPISLDAFRAGYSDAISQSAHNNGIAGTFDSLIGGFDPDDATTFMRDKAGGVENLKLILGDKKAEKLIEELANKSEVSKYNARMKAMLEEKKIDPRAISDIIREGDHLLMTGALTPGQQTIMANASLGAMGRMLRHKGPAEAELGQRLFTAKGPEGVKEIENFLQNFEATSEFPTTGGRTGAVVPTDDKEDKGPIQMEKLIELFNLIDDLK